MSRSAWDAWRTIPTGSSLTVLSPGSPMRVFWDAASVKWAEAIRRAPADDPVGPFLAYHPKQWMGFRIIDFEDPYMEEHGIEGWAKRLSRPFLELAHNDPRYAQVLGTLFANFLQKGDIPPRTFETWVRESLGIPFQDNEWN